MAKRGNHPERGDAERRAADRGDVERRAADRGDAKRRAAERQAAQRDRAQRERAADRVYTLDDPEALRALAHPLRGKLLAALRLDGPATASMLGRRYGETSGSTSYHLRMLARYGFVEDDPGHPGARERWWRAAHELTEWQPAAFFGAEPGEGEAARLFLRRVLADYMRWQAQWIDEIETWEPAWQEAAELSDLALRLTPAQLRALNDELLETIYRYREVGPDGDDAERAIVLLHSFPQKGELP